MPIQSVIVANFCPSTLPPNTAVHTVAYFGVVDVTNPFDSVTIQASNNFDLFNYDSLTAGFVITVPEPGSVALLVGIVTAGAGFVRKRRSLR